MNAPPLPNTPAAKPPPKSRGCFFYGCLTVVVVGLIAALFIGGVTWYTVKKVNEAIDTYTATAPVTLPTTEISDTDYQTLEERVATYEKDLMADQAAGNLVLSATELNALLNRNKAMEAWNGRLHVMMDEDQVRGQVSLPLDPIAQVPLFSKLRGRYLNGAARLDVQMQGGRLAVRLVDLEVNGQPLPAEFMQGLQQVNWADPAYEDPDQAAFLSKIGRVQIRDGQLVIVPASAE